MKWFSLLALPLLVVACATQPKATLNIELRKSEDAAAILSTARKVVVAISSRSGIGAAKLIRTGSTWPPSIIIQLGVSNLESFKMDNGRICVDTSLKSPRLIPYWKAGSFLPSSAAPEGNLEITKTRTVGTIEVAVPKEMLAGNPEVITFEWIDEFRN